MSEVQEGTVLVGIPQGLMGWEGKEAEVTLIAQIKGPRKGSMDGQHTPI